MSLNFIVVLNLAAMSMGIVSGMLLLYFGLKYNSTNVPLAISQLSTGLLVWFNFSLFSGLIIHWPFLYGLGNAFPLIFIPMSFFYVVFHTQRRSWKWYDTFHVIPLLIYVADYWNLFLMPTAEKVEMIRQILDNQVLSMDFKESQKYFGPGFHWQFQTIMFSLYWVVMVVVFVRWLRSQPSLTPQNKVWRNWMITFLAYQFLLWFFHFLNLFGLTFSNFEVVISASVSLWMVLTLVIFFFPSIMYGSKITGLRVVIPEEVNGKAPLAEAERQKLEAVMHTMEDYIEEKKPFLKAGYGINDFSKDINIPVYQITKAFSTVKDMGFVEYTNQKRIQYCIVKFNQGEWINYTLEAVATECGFSNRNSFTQAFNRFSGESPSVYRRRLRKVG
ncbi:MAG: helix-turn-helix transcriptional regulator [Cyclobacteriaceae bacterium]|nr:helix-turn-helix transcriptional regulator [Cyclobacteriaceae bacterium]